MKVSDFTIGFLGEAIAGDCDGFPYRSGPNLVRFFNRFGFRDVYPSGGGFPTRRVYAQDKLHELNGTARLDDALLAAVDPRLYVKQEFGAGFAVSQLNDHLQYDGFELVREGLSYKLRSLTTGRITVNPEVLSGHATPLSTIDEHIRKCEGKLSEGDYSGAITNARALIESALLAIEEELDPQGIVHDGDLPKQFKRVQKLINLAPGRTDIDASLKQVLNGLTSIVNGLSSVRNKMSDSHASTFPAKQHHAQLAVHSAVTLVNFLYQSKTYQDARQAPTGLKS